MRWEQVFVFALLVALLSACVAVQPVPGDSAMGGQETVTNQTTANEAAANQTVADEHDHTMDMSHELGTVNFPISCSPEAQAEFNHGMALLHSFWFGPAKTSFNTVAELDPDCAMAHWGLAMTLMGNPFSWPLSGQPLVDGWAEVEKAMAAGTPTAREQAYIDAVAAFYKDADSVDHRTRALAYNAAMEQVAQTYPDDTEAAIYHALALLSTALPTDKSYANQLQAVDILDDILVEQPNHPGVAHYLIHSNDVPALAAHGLDAALRYADIAPAAPHAQHMPSHIFTRLGYWHESIDTNLVSAAAAKQELGSDQAGLTSSSVLHPQDYMMYAYLQLGHINAAKALLDEVQSITKVAVENSVAAYALAAIPSRYALERGEWAEAAALTLYPPDFAWDKFPQAEALLVFARALGAARAGDADAARQDVDRLAELRDALVEIKQDYWAGQTDIQIKEVEAWIAMAEGSDEQALALMQEAVTLENATEKNAVTPGPLVPAHELLGEMYLELEQPAEGLKEFEASHVIEPNRFRGLYGAAHAAELAGETEKATTYYEELLVLGETADAERAELTAAKAFLQQ